MKIYEAQGPGLPLDGKGKTKNEKIPYAFGSLKLEVNLPN